MTTMEHSLADEEGVGVGDACRRQVVQRGLHEPKGLGR
jgi:hypothetical protein